MSRSHLVSRGRHRLIMMGVTLVLAGAIPGTLIGLRYNWFAGAAVWLAVGWSCACLMFFAFLRFAIRHYTPEQTRAHATEDYPGRDAVDTLTFGASFVSVAAIIALEVGTRDTHGGVVLTVAIISVITVFMSWTLIHILYMLTYARIYYSDPVGGIDFNAKGYEPAYVDFAYLAFDLGMTYQVSDTSVSTRELRAVILKHTLLSWVFGAVVLASVINLVAGLN